MSQQIYLVGFVTFVQEREVKPKNVVVENEEARPGMWVQTDLKHRKSIGIHPDFFS